MFYLLFVFYFLLIGFLLKNNKFFTKSEIGLPILIVIFSLKTIAGVFYSYYFSLPSQINGADTWSYFIESKAETDWLLNNPKTFFTDLFENHYSQTGNLFSSTNSFWNDLKATFFIKVLAILNVFSCKNYYINLLFFNAFFIFGGVAFYRLFKENFIINKLILLVAIFFTPSFLFWCSSIHKDGIVFSATAISLYTFYKTLNYGFVYKRTIVLLLCLIVIFLLRNYYLLAIFPAFIGWFWVEKYKSNPKIVFASIIAVCLTTFFFSSSFNITKGISNPVVAKHSEFLQLDGNTKFKTPSLKANTISIIKYFPFAMQAVLLRPYPRKNESLQILFLVIENYISLAIMLFAFIYFFKKKNKVIVSPIIYACLTISFLLFLFIGYIVCFDAAIIRYRSISSPFLIVSCIIIIFGKTKDSKLVVNINIDH